MSNIIRCSCCGQEYLPSEIFVPNAFFGKPGDIVKDDSGKIEFFTGSDMCLEEEYTCDNCGKTFKVTANISFDISDCGTDDFEEEYVTTIKKKPKAILDEGLF